MRNGNWLYYRRREEISGITECRISIYLIVSITMCIVSWLLPGLVYADGSNEAVVNVCVLISVIVGITVNLVYVLSSKWRSFLVYLVFAFLMVIQMISAYGLIERLHLL